MEKQNSVESWSNKDLLDLFGVPKTLEELDTRSDDLIDKALAQGKGALADFIEQAANKLRRQLFTPPMNDSSYDQGLRELVKESITQQYPNPGGDGRQRGSAYRVLEGSGIPRVVPQNLRLDQRTEFPSKYAQGFVNPSFVQSYTRTIVLNSAFRANPIPYIPGDVYGPSSSTSYHATLSEPLKMTTSLKLQSVSVPRVWDNISCALGNSIIGLVNYPSPEAVIDSTNIAWYKLEDGAYDAESIAGRSLPLIGDTLPPGLPGEIRVEGEGSGATGTSLIISSDGITTSNNLAIPNPYTKLSLIVGDGTEQLPISIVMYADGMPSCSVGEKALCSNVSSTTRNLATTLGFSAERVQRTSDGKTVVIARAGQFLEAPDLRHAENYPDFIGIKYLLIALDDFNYNRATTTLVGIADAETKITPTKSPFMEVINGQCLNAQTNPRSRTQKQIFSENSKLVESREPDSSSISPRIPNLLSLCPIPNGEFGELITLTGTAVNSSERTYFGPVNLEKVKVSLHDERGRLIDLKGHDWAVTLTAEQMYQY